MIIEKCNPIIDGMVNKLSERWQSKDDNPLEIILLSDLDFFAQEFYEHLNLSLLSGEYLNTGSVLDKITKLKVSVSNVSSCLELIEDTDVKSRFEFLMFQTFVKPTNNSLRLYHKFVYDLDRRINGHDENLFSAWLANTGERKELIIEENDVFRLEKIFASNIMISTIDHNLSVDKDDLSELILLKKNLEDNVTISPFYKQIIIDKCEFIIRKINYRFKEDEKNYTYAFEFQDSEIDSNSKLEFFDSFHEKTLLHYNINNRGLDKKGWNALYDRIVADSLPSFNDLHTALQFYKDIAKDIIRVTNLRTQFEQRCTLIAQKGIDKFESETIAINKNYFANNQFSLYLAKDETTFDAALEMLKGIETIQHETFVQNYFPYLVFCNFLCRKIDHMKSDLSKNLSFVVKYFDVLETYLEQAYKSFEWCKDKKFQSFQLPKNESTISINLEEYDRKVDLYMASSFILPINYVKVEKDLQVLSKKIDVYRTVIDVHKSISREKSQMRQIRKEVEKIDRRAIEIIGVFSAIVLFASGSIQIFSIDGITIKDGLNWMLLFSYSLILFIFLIWLITRDGLAIKGLSIIHWAFLGGLILLSAVSLSYVFGWFPFR